MYILFQSLYGFNKMKLKVLLLVLGYLLYLHLEWG